MPRLADRSLNSRLIEGWSGNFTTHPHPPGSSVFPGGCPVGAMPVQSTSNGRELANRCLNPPCSRGASKMPGSPSAWCGRTPKRSNTRPKPQFTRAAKQNRERRRMPGESWRGPAGNRCNRDRVCEFAYWILWHRTTSSKRLESTDNTQNLFPEIGYFRFQRTNPLCQFSYTDPS